MATRDTFKENLRYYRKQKHLTQEKLSELIGYGGTYITELESRYKFPKPETIDLIAQVLGIEPYQLFCPQGHGFQEEAARRALLKEIRTELNTVLDSHLC